jgi:hypothetical protein
MLDPLHITTLRLPRPLTGIDLLLYFDVRFVIPWTSLWVGSVRRTFVPLTLVDLTTIQHVHGIVSALSVLSEHKSAALSGKLETSLKEGNHHVLSVRASPTVDL